MLSWKNKKSRPGNECVEEVFFRTMLIISLVGSSTALCFDVLMTSSFGYSSWMILLFMQVLILALYAIKKILFKYITFGFLLAMVILITYRGLTYSQYDHVTYALIITLGFICSLTTKGLSRNILKVVVFCSLISMLFKNYGHSDFLLLLRQAVPYVMIYFIVTVSSGVLKDRYERNQIRLMELVTLLNQKNAKINDQHSRLLKSYDQLANLNENLEETVKKKTFLVEERNKQLAEIAFANAHRVRGPLARILGLLHLMDIDPIKKETYLLKIHGEAWEMDEIVRVLGRSIEKNIAER
jgi:signal transduction histidine kinase